MILVYMILTCVNIFIVAKIISVEIKRKSPFVFTWLFLLLFFFLPALGDVILSQGFRYTHPLSISYVLDLETLLFSQLYAFVVLVSYFLVLKILQSYSYTKFESSLAIPDVASLKYVYILVFISIFSAAYYYFAFGKSEILDMGFTELRNEMPFIVRVGIVYTQFLYLGLGAYFVYNRKFVSTLFLGILIGALFIFVGGSRQPIVVYALVLLYCSIYTTRWGQKPSYYILLTVLSIPTLFLAQVLLSTRNTTGFANKLAFLGDALTFKTDVIASSETSLRFVYYYFVQSYNEIPDFGQFQYLLRTVLFFWPDSVLKGVKPGDFEYTMYDAFMIGLDGTMHPLLFGTLIADTGLFFLPWIILLACVSWSMPFIYNRVTSVYKAVLLGACCYAAMMYGRGSFYGVTVILVLSAVFCLIMSRWVHKQQLRRIQKNSGKRRRIRSR